MEDAAAFMATQGGGASVGGPTQAQPPSFDPGQPLPPVREIFKQALDTAKDSFGEMFDNRAGIIDPGPGADLNKPPPELEDPAEREQRAAAERAARDEARAPYLAATRPAVELTRFATTGRAQLEDVIERLRHYDPARVFGVYRVPDRYELNRNSENKVRVEWEIAHAPGAAADGEVHMAAFDRAGHWAARRFGEPEVFDEDVAGALVRRANLQPEDCFGVPRLLHVRATNTDYGKSWSATSTASSSSAAPRWPRPTRRSRPRRRWPSGRRRSTPRCSTGRRSPRGSPPPATPGRARPRRCRTSRAAGRS